MKKYFLITLLIPMMAICWGCSSYDEDNSGSSSEETAGLKEVSVGKPDWQVDLVNNEETPDWQAPDPSRYENWMIFVVRIQEELKSYMSDDDMMALFVGDELRGVNHPAKAANGQQATVDESTYFILRVWGNEPSNQEVNATIKLWSSKLRHTFTLKGKGKIIPESVKGVDTEFLPDIALGSAKYPCTTWVNISFNPQDYGLEYSQDDMMAVFIGNECRGIRHIYRDGFNANPRILLFGLQEGETARLLYYNAKSDRVYDTDKTFKTASQAISINLNNE